MVDVLAVLRTMRCSSGMQEPQWVPHCNAPCNFASRSEGVPEQVRKLSSIAESLTLKQVHTTLPSKATGTGGLLTGSSSARP
jgi:hypothetical protein